MHTFETDMGEVESCFANYDDANGRLEEIMQSLPEEVQNAVNVIISYGGIDGSHHKDWCMDQVLRELLKDEEVYNQLIDASCWDEDDGPWAYEYEQGTPP